MKLCAATIDDIALIRSWDQQPHVLESAGDFFEFDWEGEIPRDVDWRELLIAEVDGRSRKGINGDDREEENVRRPVSDDRQPQTPRAPQQPRNIEPTDKDLEQAGNRIAEMEARPGHVGGNCRGPEAPTPARKRREQEAAKEQLLRERRPDTNSQRCHRPDRRLEHGQEGRDICHEEVGPEHVDQQIVRAEYEDEPDERDNDITNGRDTAIELEHGVPIAAKAPGSPPGEGHHPHLGQSQEDNDGEQQALVLWHARHEPRLTTPDQGSQQPAEKLQSSLYDDRRHQRDKGRPRALCLVAWRAGEQMVCQDPCLSLVTRP